jgi:glutamine amidotransferase
MCRLFAMRAAGPTSVLASLSEGANSLSAQSRKDSRGQAHVDGWGLAWYDAAGLPRIEKSLRPAHDDPRFHELARSVSTATALAHVRQASVGSVSLANTHPFVHGRWVFAHNGTLQDFAARRGPLLRAIPDDLRQCIRGDTDSEHAFYFWLGKLRAAAGSLDGTPDVAAVIATLQQTVRELDEWFPTHDGEESKFNFVATDGRLLAATRCRHKLSYLEHRGDAAPPGATAGRVPPGCSSANPRPADALRPLLGNPAVAPSAVIRDFRAVLIASEPTAADGWREVPDRSLIVFDERFEVHAASLDAKKGTGVKNKDSRPL